ncbi:rho guanine nucleotide exchange factor 12 isoform X2 [Antennarius striatus]|uniref:rho guanine nucleotide exchange factor 12 isoform X2 n=1 Tax=Antennarius striatus TaxID=241820 RepID=UPI0035B1442C
MSSTQTLTDRTPNILNKDPAEKKPRHENSPVPLKHDFDPTGLVQRCVIIQRDENGFGLTVSGDNPVFVQLVKEDGAAMRAGVQTGDRIIKVNGTLVTHSNHIEVVKLIKSGSYVALTVLGRPPGLVQVLEEPAEVTSCLSAPHSPAPPGRETSSHVTSSTSCSLQGDVLSPPPDGDGGSSPPAEEGDGGPSLAPPPCGGANNGKSSIGHCTLPVSAGRREEGHTCPSPDPEDTPDTDTSTQCIVGSPPYLINPEIIGAEDDYFESQQEEINGECSSFQSVDLLKARPAHLAVFLHHVVSQFDPAPLLCYLHADMFQQTSSRDSRRVFLELHSIFLDRAANLKVPLPEAITAELEKRKLDLIPDEICRQLVQILQESLLPDLKKNLEDFRQKRSMGLTLAEDQLSRLDLDLEKECSCAEHILSRIEDILLTSPPTEEEKSQTMQFVILTYMKHLGVKTKEPRGLEPKRARINFLPKIKKSIKPEKDGEEKVKKTRFPSILGPPRRLSRVDSTSVGRAVDLNKQRSPKPASPPAAGAADPPDAPGVGSGRTRGGHLSEGLDAGVVPTTPPTLSPPTSQASDAGGPDSDPNASPFGVQSRPGEGPPSGDQQDAGSSPTSPQFSFSPPSLEQLQEEEQDAFRMEACSGDAQSEDEPPGEVEGEEDPLNWQSLVSPEVLTGLTPQQVKRQEVIHELFTTERAHVRTLRVLDGVFYQRLTRHAVLPPQDVRHIFTNLEEIVQLHVSITEQMTAIRRRSETSVIGQIADDLLGWVKPVSDDLLGWFSGEEEEKITAAVGTFCSNQPSALELIKSRKKKDQKFHLFMQEAESNRLCRRLQLKDIIPMEMQRVTKYPLLLENIAKYTEDGEEKEKVKKAAECCKQILNHVNQAVREAENKQKLEEYQRRLDISSLKQSENPVVLELKNLDLTKRKMFHEGPLSWKVNKDKMIELYTLLLEDVLVLLQKQDERLVLRFHGKNVASASDTKHIFSPVIKLSTVLVRPVATDNRSFFVLSMSDNGPQIYELTAQTVSDQRTWQCLITQCADAMKAKGFNRDMPAAQSDAEGDDIIKQEKTSEGTSGGSVHPSDSSPYPPSMNPFDGLKLVDEEEEAAVGGCHGDENDDEEVDEAELEAFLDGQLMDRLQEDHAPGSASRKGDDALRTLAMLKQTLFNHLMGREESRAPGGPGGPEGPSDESQSAADSQEDDAHAGRNGGFVVLDFAADDDSEDVGIDMTKLLSSSSQAGGAGGPNLSRQLMTHLRLLQADLQYLKEVELKYNQLTQPSCEVAATADDVNNGIQ